MSWTKETPTRAGAYWWRLNKETDHIRCVREVFSTRSGYLLERASDRHPIYLGGEWCGPLLPAEELEKAYHEGVFDANSNMHGLEARRYNGSRARRVAEGEEA